jgi:hypothetical protein
MMRCKQVQRQLAEYVDDLLGARERDAVKAHLARCEGCRIAARDIAAAARALSALRVVRPPASFAPRVRSAIRALMLLGIVGTRYLVQPSLYVASARTVTVAMASAAPAEPASTEVRRDSVGAPTAQLANPSHRSAQHASWRPSGLTRSLSAITGPAPSKDGLAPKKADENPAPGAPSATPPRAVPDKPAAPALGRGSLHLTAVADGGAAPRLAEETPGEARRLVAVPVSDKPSAPTTTPSADVALTAGVRGGTAGAGSATDADTPFGFDDIFNESSLPRYADVS